MKFTDAYKLITEHHGDEFNPKLMSASIKKLLDVLGKDESNKDLYKTLEKWITANEEKML